MACINFKFSTYFYFTNVVSKEKIKTKHVISKNSLFERVLKSFKNKIIWFAIKMQFYETGSFNH